jgi:hypothetical protein
MGNDVIIETELKRSSPEKTESVILDAILLLIESEGFNELPLRQRSNITTELAELGRFKKRLANDFITERQSTDSVLPGSTRV